MKKIISILMFLGIGLLIQAQTQPWLSGTTSPVSTYNGSDGSITLTVGGGTSPYTFKWSNGAVTQNITNLIAGSYGVTVTDSQGIRAMGIGNVQITTPPQSSGMYVNIQTGMIYDFTTAGLKTTVAKGDLIPIPNDLLGLAKTTLKGTTSGKVDLRYNNGLTRWIKTQR